MCFSFLSIVFTSFVVTRYLVQIRSIIYTLTLWFPLPSLLYKKITTSITKVYLFVIFSDYFFGLFKVSVLYSYDMVLCRISCLSFCHYLSFRTFVFFFVITYITLFLFLLFFKEWPLLFRFLSSHFRNFMILFYLKNYISKYLCVCFFEGFFSRLLSSMCFQFS